MNVSLVERFLADFCAAPSTYVLAREVAILGMLKNEDKVIAVRAAPLVPDGALLFRFALCHIVLRKGARRVTITDTGLYASPTWLCAPARTPNS
jgi:hypothetical protein